MHFAVIARDAAIKTKGGAAGPSEPEEVHRMFSDCTNSMIKLIHTNKAMCQTNEEETKANLKIEKTWTITNPGKKFKKNISPLLFFLPLSNSRKPD